MIDLPSVIASKLAVYAGAYLAVLGPRDWNCSAELDMSSDSVRVFPGKGAKPNGPTVVIEFDGGDDVHSDQRIISLGSRFFPKIITKSDVKSYLADNNNLDFNGLPKKHASDRVRYLNDSMLVFESSGGTFGMGDDILNGWSAGPKPGATMSYGFIGIGPTSIGHPYDITASRMPASLVELNLPIVAFGEHCFKELITLPEDTYLRPDGPPFCSIEADYPSP